MSRKFVVKQKSIKDKEEKSVVMTLRIDKDLQEEYDRLSVKSERSRNELMCMALRYALENLEFIPENDEK
jgi:predicted transcriptional regulator